MLGSITPLGERGRGSRWGLTVSAYVLGSTIGGAAMGTMLGAVGAPVASQLRPEIRLLLLGLFLLVGLALDLRLVGARLPTIHRQVDENWRVRYRGWVWGLGFGLQLGLGVITIVTTSTVYATWFAAVSSGGWVGGLAIGLAFGLARALPVFAVAGVRRPDQVLRIDGVLTRLAVPARRLTYVAGSFAAGLALMGAVRW
jgi:hypothetical protein